jgi:hypothetical protein
MPTPTMAAAALTPMAVATMVDCSTSYSSLMTSCARSTAAMVT